MKYQIVSDLHLEFYDTADIQYEEFISKTDAECLILAGDICTCSPQLDKFLEHVSKEYKYIVYIPGNHEYYGGDIHATKILLKDMCSKYPNVHLLDNGVFIPNEETVILGTTLWSYIPEEHKHIVKNGMSDFYRIGNMTEHRGFNIDDMNCLYLDNNKKWLEEMLESYGDGNNSDEETNKYKTIIVVTHHLPTFELIHPKYLGSQLNYAFANSGLESLIGQASVWVAGHSHSSAMKEINGCLCVTNPRGYKHEINPEYVSGYVFDL